MTVNFTRLRGVETQLKRIADCLEIIVAEQYQVNVRPPAFDKSGPEPEAVYTDQEEYAVREYARRMGHIPPEPLEDEPA